MTLKEWDAASEQQRRQWLLDGQLLDDEGGNELRQRLGGQEWPGRWHVSTDDKWEQPQVLSEGGSLVASIAHECVRPRHELVMNARLVAAAPDLLALAERAIVICCEAERRGHKDLEVMYIWRGKAQLFRPVAQEIIDEIKGRF